MKLAYSVVLFMSFFILPIFGKPTILLAVSNSEERKTFSQLCSSRSSNDIRSCDDCGCGHFGASRGGRTHQGIDIKCDSGSTIYAPFPAKVVREAKPYGNGKSHDTGILLKGTGSWSDFEVKLFYFKKTAPNGQVVAAGDDIGTMLDMAKEYTCKMTNHVHVQLYKNGDIVDPTPYV